MSKVLAWAIVAKNGMLQKLYYVKPGAVELSHWDKGSGWQNIGPHRVIELAEAPKEPVTETLTVIRGNATIEKSSDGSQRELKKGDTITYTIGESWDLE